MNSTWKSLLWKEWREQRWRLVALTVLLALPAVWLFFYLAAYGSDADFLSDFLNILTGFAACYVVLAGCFLGMHVAGGENARRTMRFMQALPMPMWKTGLVKILVASFVSLIPLMILYGVLCAIWPYLAHEDTLRQTVEEMSLKSRQSWQFGDIYTWSAINMFIGMLGVTSLLIWMTAGGVNRSDEVRAGAIGFLICVSAWMVFAILMGWAVKFIPFLQNMLLFLLPALPGGPAYVSSFNLDLHHQLDQFSQSVLAVIALISHGAVMAWYLTRFGRVAIAPKKASGFEIDLFLWKKAKHYPIHSQWRAIAWKQVRETGPLAAMTFACILMITPVVNYINIKNDVATDFEDILGAVTLSAGFFVILVAGVGVFLEDFAPGVNNFWRSRPVSIKLWFTVKYLVGLSVLAFALGSLLILSQVIKTGFEYQNWFLTVVYYATYCLALLYTLSMVSYCLLRQPIYAAVLTFALFLCGMMSIERLFPDTRFSIAFYPMLTLALVVPLIVSYLAVKHDWGWKVGR